MKKKSILLYFITLLLIFPLGLYAQSQKVKLSGSKITLKSAFEQIEKQTGLSIDYDSKTINLNDLVTTSAKEMPVGEAVELLLKGTNYAYSFSNNHIVVKKALNDTKALKQGSSRTVKGTITDSNGDPIIGATVVEKNTQNGTVTDLNGNYSLSNVASNATLVVSYVGMKTQELVLNGKPELSVSLSDDAINLSEVVAIGYGTQKKRDVTGSLETIKADVFKQTTNSSNITAMLQGQAAGVSVQTSNGGLGSGATVLIRGLSSINAGTAPLYIIDGVPAGTSLINQADVESVQILKDAAATAIYGAKGS
ncbi:MAG: susC1, partial [Bacteroidetes bacterium]|nr:susC1 [Bacteroidota bacterium]